MGTPRKSNFKNPTFRKARKMGHPESSHTLSLCHAAKHIIRARYIVGTRCGCRAYGAPASLCIFSFPSPDGLG
jgi:hypothetical protein